MTNMASHSAPNRHRISLMTLMFGACGAPVIWLGQEILGFGVSSQACYGSDHPTVVKSAMTLRGVLLGFDMVALLVALAAGIVSCVCWCLLHDEKKSDAESAIEIGDGRARFMALWGIMSSLWFFATILFATIASASVPLCSR